MYRSEDWINEVCSRVIKNKKEDFKMIAMLNRFNNEALMKFNAKAERINTINKPPSVNTLRKIKGIHYTRKAKDKQ